MEGRLDGYAFAASRPELGLPQMSRETQSRVLYGERRQTSVLPSLDRQWSPSGFRTIWRSRVQRPRNRVIDRSSPTSVATRRVPITTMGMAILADWTNATRKSAFALSLPFATSG